MRARSAAVLVLAAIVVAAAWHRAPSPARRRASSLERTWRAPAPHYDYLKAITFARGGVGNMVWGYGQAVRCDIDFRWRRAGDGAVELTYLREPLPPRRLAFAVEGGRFDVRDPGPGGDRTIHYRCRLTFGDTPFPAGCDTQRVYYGCAD